MPRILAMEKPAMLYVDGEIHQWCFPDISPIVNARAPEQVFEGLKRAYQDREWLQNLAEHGQQWYRPYHSNAVVRDCLISFY